jgi:hypothetical protein
VCQVDVVLFAILLIILNELNGTCCCLIMIFSCCFVACGFTTLS